jgi:hypothetical protein
MARGPPSQVRRPRPSTSNGEGTFAPAARSPAERISALEDDMGRGLLLWLIGIPLPIILLIWLFGGLN